MAKAKKKAKVAKKINRKVRKKLPKGVEKQGSELTYKPDNFAVFITCQGKVLMKWLRKKLREYETPIQEAAKKEFKRYPNLQRVVVEVYKNNDTRQIKISARSEGSMPPEGTVLARCLKYRVKRPKQVMPACEYVGSRWDIDFVEPNKRVLKQLGFDGMK